MPQLTATKQQAQQALEMVKNYFRYAIDGDNAPKLIMDWDWFGEGRGTPSIVWEEGPYEWAIMYTGEHGRMPKGVFAEPATSWALSLYSDPSVDTSQVGDDNASGAEHDEEMRFGGKNSSKRRGADPGSVEEFYEDLPHWQEIYNREYAAMMRELGYNKNEGEQYSQRDPNDKSLGYRTDYERLDDKQFAHDVAKRTADEEISRLKQEKNSSTDIELFTTFTPTFEKDSGGKIATDISKMLEPEGEKSRATSQYLQMNNPDQHGYPESYSQWDGEKMPRRLLKKHRDYWQQQSTAGNDPHGNFGRLDAWYNDGYDPGTKVWTAPDPEQQQFG